MKRFILSGPAAIGKSTYAKKLAALMGIDSIIDDWNGSDTLPDFTLAITNADFIMPKGAVAFQVEDAGGLDALVNLLRYVASPAPQADLEMLA